LSLFGVLSAIFCPFVPVWCFVGHIFLFHHTGTKEQSMADKAPHRDKRTIYGRQSTT
jgi:hypothetical protein